LAEEIIPAKPKGDVFPIDVGTTPVRVLHDNPYRINWSAKNLGTANVYWGKSARVASSGPFQGWEITAAGGSVSDEWWTGEVWMVAASGTQRVIVSEDAATEIRPWRKPPT